MWNGLEYVWAMYLAILAIGDIKSRTISWLGIAMGFVLLLGSQYFVPETYVQRVLGICLGAIFLLISKVTKEAIGYGDCFIFLLLGGVLGAWKLMICLSIGFLTCFVCGIVTLAIKKCRKEVEIPFMPFLCFSYILTTMYL